MYQTAIIDRSGVLSRNLTSSSVWKAKENHIFSAVSNPDAANVIWIAVDHPDNQSLLSVQQFVNQRPNAAVLLLCGRQNSEFTRNAFLSGVFDCLTSPIGDPELNRIFQRLERKFIPDFSPEIQHQEQELINHLLRNNPETQESLEVLLQSAFAYCGDSHSDPMMLLPILREQLLNLILQKAPFLEHFMWSDFFTCRFHSQEQTMNAWSADCDMIQSVLDRYQTFTQQHVREAARYIMMHPNGKLSLNEIASVVHLNSSYLSHLFRQEAGVTLVQYVTEQKMNRAKILLLNDEMKIHEIAILLGYNEAEYFRKIFKNTCGVSPSLCKSNLFACRGLA